MQGCSTEFVVRHAFLAMGTRFEFVTSCAESRRVHAQAALEEAAGEIHRLHARYSFFDRASFLSHVNREAAHRAVSLDEESWDIFAACRDVWEGSGGAFDPTIAPLMYRWGLRDAAPGGSTGPSGARSGCLPDSNAVDVSASEWGFQHVELDAHSRAIRFATPGISLDLGSIVKGHAIDAAARTLREAGVTSALLHGGTSSVMAVGGPTDADAWEIRVGGFFRAPVAWLRDGAVSVSAPYGRTAKRADGGIVGHVIDPRSGMPASAFVCAAVVHASARASDAWSTALLVSGKLPASARGRGWIAADEGGTARWRSV